MRWMREHKLISCLLVILLILVIFFVMSIASGEESSGITGLINQGMSYISKPLTRVTEAIGGSVSGLFSYKKLQVQIENLREENDSLRRQLSAAQLDESELAELRELSGLLHYDYTEKELEVVTADITSMDGANWTNIFTIDRGTESGIVEGSVVINGVGLVGKVTDAGEGWAKVVSIIDDGSKVSFVIVRDRKLLGVVSGNQQGSITGYMLKGDAAVAEGDIIITSGMGTFPAGLEIGNVKSVTYNSDTLLKEITVEPAVDFKSLKKVAVIL